MRKLLSLSLLITYSTILFAQNKIKGEYDPVQKKFTPENAEYNFLGFGSGYFLVKKDKKIGLVDTTGVIRCPIAFDQAYLFTESPVSFQVKLNDKWGIIDSLGNYIIPIAYKNIQGSDPRVFVFADTGKGWKVFTVHGKQIEKYTLDELPLFCIFSSGLLPLKQKGRWGYINLDGELAIPFQYQQAGNFIDGLAPVKINNKWGYIDVKNTVIIKPKYEDAVDFSEGLASVKLNNKYGYIDTTGKLIVNFNYDSRFAFKKGYAPVRKCLESKNGMCIKAKYGIINNKGILFKEIVYDDLVVFVSGSIDVKLNDKWETIRFP